MKLELLSCVEITTRNARKMKYYSLLCGDGGTLQLTKDVQGVYYVDGVATEDKELVEQLEIYVKASIKQSDINRIIRDKHKA